MSRAITPAPTPSQTITVSSTAGFNAGDLVYFNGSTGDYGTPPVSAAGASVNVPVTGSAPLLGGLVGSTAQNVGIVGGCSTTGFAAILTNGNIVQVYFKADTEYPAFRIVDTTNTVIVAETIINTLYTQTGTPNITVAALTGGGFAVAWLNTAGGTVNKPCYAVYSNAGAVVTAAAQDTGGTGIGTAASVIRIKATPSGGFIISYTASASSVINARGYSATGVAAFAWVSLATSSSTSITGLAVRSNGDFLLTGFVSTTSTVYAIWSSTGAVVVSSTSFVSTNGTFNYATDAACLSDGTTFVIVYAITIGGPTTAFRFLPAGNVLGSEFYIPYTNFLKAAGSNSYTQDITPLSGNRFILCMSSAAANLYPLCYAIFNSSGVCLSGVSGTTSTAAVPINIPQAYFSWSQVHVSALESPTGYITLYYGNYDSKNYSVQYSTIDNSTYFLVNVTPTTQFLGNATPTPLAYAPAGSNPLGASYSVAAGNYPVSGTFGAVIKTPEIVDSATTNSIATTTLPNGQVLVAYITNGGVVKVAVYSIAGVFIQTLTIAASGANTIFTTYSAISISALTSGKFVIAYASSDTGYQIKLYSSAFTQIGSTISITTSSFSTGYPLNVAGITDDRYVVGYSIATFPTYRIYDNTNTQLVAATTVTALNHLYVNVAGFSGGGFFISAVTSGGSQVSTTYANYSGNTFTQLGGLTTIFGGANNITNARPVASTNSMVTMLYASGAGSVNAYTAIVSTNTATSGSSISTLTSLNGSTVGLTGSGVPVITGQLSGVMQISSSLAPDNTQIPLSSTLFKPYVTTAASQNSMTPSYGGNVGIAYIDINQKVNYAIVCGTSAPLFSSLTSASVSTPINIYPGATSATPAIQNTVFTGVALQTVPAGGAGLVQVSGTAQLGSTYSSTTTYRAFDHQSQGVPGVKGTITGRAITLQGT